MDRLSGGWELRDGVSDYLVNMYAHMVDDCHEMTEGVRSLL